jgi:hypothetical protein
MSTHSRRLIASFALSLCVVAMSAASASAAWTQPVPAPLNGGQAAVEQQRYEDQSLAMVVGVPYVAWTERVSQGGFGHLHVSRLNAAGTAWEPVGEPFEFGTEQPSLASIGGIPYVAFSNGGVVKVRRLSAAGTEWEDVGNPISSVGFPSSLSLASIGGVPYLAWGDTGIHVSRLNDAGTAWEPVGPATPPSAGSGVDPSLAEIGGFPHVAYTDTSGPNTEIRVSRLNDAGTGWQAVAGGPSPINHAPDRDAQEPSLASVDGVPYVAWTEWDGDNMQLRVSRRNTEGTAWEEVVGGESPLNHRPDAFALPSWINPHYTILSPRLTAIGGMPYVAWAEYDGLNHEVRVSRLDGAGESWEEVVGGDSPINQQPNGDAWGLDLASAGGVPYVAWTEDLSGADQQFGSQQVRVTRLEPDFLAQAAFATDTRALLLSKVRTYGVAYPIAFQYGLGGNLDNSTDIVRTAFGNREDTAITTVGGLSPGGTYSWRPIGFDERRTTGEGPVQTFTTTRPDEEQLLLAVLAPRMHSVAGRRVTVRYFATAPANVRLRVRRHGKAVATVHAQARPGANRISWNGRIGGRRPQPGNYRLVLRATGADGQTASDLVDLRITRRRASTR